MLALADAKQLAVLKLGLENWNQWRRDNGALRVDLSYADLRAFDLSLMPSLRVADSKGLIPRGSSWTFIANEIVGYEVDPLDLRQADLRGANLDGADLRCADCSGADLSGASLRGAELGHASLSGTRLVGADLSGSALRGADLSECVLVKTNLTDADIGYTRVYGVSVWDLAGRPRDETNLIVTPRGDTTLSADSLALSQFLYLLIRNQNLREVIDTVTTKVVLILGAFGEDRKRVLDGIRDRLRTIGFIPVVFDFVGPASKDTTGTVETLARMSRFVLADLTAPSSIPHELATIVPFLRTTPVLMLRQVGASGYSMVKDLRAYPWVLDTYEYESEATLLKQISEVIRPACILADKLQRREG
jgi:uncharacterized protein YjbI with pentapeptide repeats